MGLGPLPLPQALHLALSAKSPSAKGPAAQQNTQAHTDARLSNSWNVTIVTWLLGQLCHLLGIAALLSVQQCIDRI